MFAEGYYIYHECDNVANQNKARLLSPALTTSASEMCVQFRYYMYGVDDKNTLKVLAKKPGGETELWKKTGIQSPSWLEASITVSNTRDQSIRVSLSELVKVKPNKMTFLTSAINSSGYGMLERGWKL